ncbi:MAG: phosphoribosyltransferase [Rhodocyclales bacterium GWA2_65_20]|nr:MAG: phosphoribosyltransferase [Rhodocyclales bacterium GWA2_65_20]
MSISHVVRGVLSALLPQECLLCGARSGDTLLCAECAGTLPLLPALHCPVCALPTSGGETCGACLKSPPAYDATFAVWRYAFPLDKLVQALKFQHRLALAGFFAAAMSKGPRPCGDLLLPLPLSPQRLKERGFNQAAEIARPLARAFGIPLRRDDCKRTLETAPQTSLPWKERRRNVSNAFACQADLTGQAVIVIDDVMTTGATLDEFARTLKRHGAVRVSNWVVARALRD